MAAEAFLSVVGLIASFLAVRFPPPVEPEVRAPPPRPAVMVPSFSSILKDRYRLGISSVLTPPLKPKMVAVRPAYHHIPWRPPPPPEAPYSKLFVWTSPVVGGLEGAAVLSYLTQHFLRLKDGTSVQHTKSLIESGVTKKGTRVMDGRLIFTCYGAPTDRNWDTYTGMRLGNRGNRLRPTSVALSPDLIFKHNLQGGESIFVKTEKGVHFLGYYDDMTHPRFRFNVDIYDPYEQLGNNSFMQVIPNGTWELVFKAGKPHEKKKRVRVPFLPRGPYIRRDFFTRFQFKRRREP